MREEQDTMRGMGERETPIKISAAPRVARGPFITTVSGLRFYILEPDPLDVCLYDIACALSKEVRFGGHSTGEWGLSVAQHAVMVSQVVDRRYAAVGLFHDAAEAYIKDIPTPLKRAIGAAYHPIESRILGVIGRRFGLDLVNLPPAVTVADLRMRATEARDLTIIGAGHGDVHHKPYDLPVVAAPPKRARDAFLDRARELGIH